MKFVTKVTQSGIARAMASALVLAVIVTSTGLSLADWGPERQDVTIRVFNGDPLQDIRVAGASLRLVADDSSNPDNGVQGTTDGNGTYFFRLYQGSYHIEVRHQDFYARDFHITVLSTFNGDLSIIPLESVPGPTPQPPAGGGCLPTPPRGIPMLNNWPISMGGEDCTDMPLVMARNVTRNQGYVSNGTVQTSTNETVRIHFYVHNGVQDFPDNIAQNVRVKGDISHSNRTATITAEAWADNANTITSAQKGGHVAVDMNPGETLEVIPGSAKVYGRGGNLIGSANDSVIGNGFNLGD
ncbi:MAG TPA: hypothetical protein VEC17_02020, partial [Candidatus Binatia bacterium]|nr:hypothetical protein [Candidatus Binatia bacterium]